VGFTARVLWNGAQFRQVIQEKQNMNMNTPYPTAGRTTWVKVATLIAAVAAAAMIIAGVVGEAASRGVVIQPGANGDRAAACQTAGVVTLPPQLQTELHAQCVGQTEP
jgi:hypothetical protein